MSLPEPELARLIAECESHPLFGRLRRYIRRIQFMNAPVWPLVSRAVSANAAESGILEISDFPDEVALIQRIGQENFERYFIEEEESSLAAAAQNCGLSLNEADRIRRFVDMACLRASEPRPVEWGSVPGEVYTCVGRVAWDGKEPSLAWVLPHLARSRYEINREGVKEFTRRGGLAKAERPALENLLRTLDWINLRQNTFQRLLAFLMKTQSSFIKTERRLDLTVLSQAKVASALDVHPTTVGRIIRGRSLLVPRGGEVPLAEFLPNRRRRAEWAIRELAHEKRNWTGKSLAGRLSTQYGIRLSQRTVNQYRRKAILREGRK
ncbi:MAG: hypothetical protein HY548_08720 [Elusimicrobia bacterium]|nr:hypothetical protein [Elusimicrobiota bacterium]